MNQKIILGVVILVIVSGIMFTKLKPGTKMTPSSGQTQGSITAMAEPEGEYVFGGEKGKEVDPENGVVKIDVTGVETNKVQFYNTPLEDGKTVYYLVLKDGEGNFRIAANANERCAQDGMGYVQEGEQIKCLKCEKSYPLADFAIEQPDCNPKPVTAKATVEESNIVISIAELKKISYLFQ